MKNKHTQLPLPINSAWDRKTYNPIVLLRRAMYNKWPYSLLDKGLDFLYIQPKIFFEGIKNIIKWTPIIYKDKNFDSHYIWEVLKFKLIQQRKYLVEANRYTGTEDVNRYITLCLNLIERIEEDYYSLEYQDYEDSEVDWGTINELGCREIKMKINSENFDEFFKKYPNTHREVLKIGFKGYTNGGKQVQAMMVSRENQKRCQNLLFKILNEKINHWWD